jgi:hypothetical protein
MKRQVTTILYIFCLALHFIIDFQTRDALPQKNMEDEVNN